MSGLTSIKIYSINYNTNRVNYQGKSVNFTGENCTGFEAVSCGFWAKNGM